MSISIPIINFHKVDPSFEWGVTRSTPRHFEKFLHFIKAEGYETITLSMLVDPQTVMPEKPLVITFDDSYESIYTHAFPLMQQYGYTGTVFVIVGFVNMWNTWDVNLGWRKFKHLSWNQVAELDHNGFEIGSHSIHHSDLTRLKDDLLNRELIESKQRLEDRLGKNTSFISYPFGKYNQKVIDLSKRAGYIRACGCLHRISFKEKNQESFVLERKAYYLFDGIWNLNAKMNHSLFAPIEQFKLRVVNFCSYGTSLVKPSKLEHYSQK